MEYIDPVCGMKVIEGKHAAQSEYKGSTVYFCSRFCKALFDKAPTRFANADRSLKPVAPWKRRLHDILGM